MNILVLELKRIGDIVMILPALNALRTAFPQAHISLCMMESYRELLPGIPMVDEALLYRRKSLNLGLLKRLVCGKWDVCLDYTGNDRAALFALLSHARRRITYLHTRRYPHRAWAYNELVDSSVATVHTIDRHLDLLAPLGIQRDAHAIPTPVPLAIPPESDREVSDLLRQEGIDGPFAVIHPGTTRAEKFWEPENWAAVIDHLQGERGLPCVLTGSRAPYEQAHLAAIRARVRTPFHDLSGRHGLLTLNAFIRRAALLLSMDSAPVHIGSTFGTPQIALFGPTNPCVWRPRHPKAIILSPGHSGPVTEFGPRVTPRSLKELPVETVTRAIALLLPGDHAVTV